MPLPAESGESPEADIFNLLFRSEFHRWLIVGFLNPGQSRKALITALEWLLAVLGGMTPKEARDYMKTFEQIAADSIGYDLDEEG